MALLNSAHHTILAVKGRTETRIKEGNNEENTIGTCKDLGLWLYLVSVMDLRLYFPIPAGIIKPCTPFIVNSKGKDRDNDKGRD